jgi:hypothetical protein
MPIIRLALLALVLSAPSLASAQGHPNFSGTWVEDESARKTTWPVPDPTAPTSRPLPPADLVVTQTDATLTTERKFMQSAVRYVYKLDGSESVNRNGANTTTTKSTWNGRKLVTQGTSFSVTSAGESLWIVTETRWLDKSGAMVTETTHKDEDGKVNVVTQVYRKK